MKNLPYKSVFNKKTQVREAGQALLTQTLRKRSVQALPTRESGQALLIILLVLSVVLTTVLSVVSRSVTDIAVTTYEEESVRALSAAEAGIEEVIVSGLVSGSIPDTTLPNDSIFSATIEVPASLNREHVYSSKLIAGDTATFWFVEHDADGNLTCSGDCFTGPQFRMCWGDPGVSGAIPALEISYYYDLNHSWLGTGDFSNVEVLKLTYDPDPSRTGSNQFGSAISCNHDFSGRQFSYETGPVIVPVDSCPPGEGCSIMARAKMLYNTNPQGIAIYQAVGAQALPLQGIQIESTGTSGDSTRKLNVFRSFPEPPPIFDSVVYSYGDLVK